MYKTVVWDRHHPRSTHSLCAIWQAVFTSVHCWVGFHFGRLYRLHVSMAGLQGGSNSLLSEWTNNWW